MRGAGAIRRVVRARREVGADALRQGPTVTRQAALVGFLLAYAVALVLLTLTPRPVSATGSWIPFAQMWQTLTDTSRTQAFVNLVGNIVLFVPLGWLLPIISFRMRSLKLALGVAAGCSLSIELCQLLFVAGRSPSVDDVILNTLGALIGGLIFHLASVTGAEKWHRMSP